MSNRCISIAEVSDLLFTAWQRIVAKDSARKIADAIIRTALQKDERISPIEDAV
jgi:hypothetical protein